MTITTDQAHRLLSGSGNVVDDDGAKIGSIGQIFLDDQTGQPEWVTVKTGMFGTAESFVPLGASDITGDDICVPYNKDKVKDAPRVADSDGHLSEEQEDELYSYYGLQQPWATSGDPTHATDYATTGTTYDRDRADVGRDTSGPTTDDAMTLSEERVRIGTETRETGKVRLRKYIVTENVTQTVPVTREEVRLEREPITDATRGDALSSGDLTTEEHEVTLHEDRVVVDKDTVPVERVRLDKDTLTEEQQVDETVRSEQIELDDDSNLTKGDHREGFRG